MQKDPFNEIVLFLDSKGVDHIPYKHKPVVTSKEAEDVRVSRDAVGLKSLLFKTEKGHVLLVLPGERKVSSRKVRHLLGVKDVRMVSPEEVYSIMGCEVGGCYPLGFICGLKMIVDSSVKEAERVVFNIGRRDRSIEMTWGEFERFIPFKEASIS